MIFGSKKPEAKRYDGSIVHPEIKRLEEELKKYVIDQDRAVKQFVRVHESYLSDLARPGRPMQNLLFVGPTGSGKTLVVEKFCEIMNISLIKVDCAEFQHDHETAKLIGAPPGYVGGEVKPKINKEAIEAKWKESGAPQYSVVLFDEIEKANVSFHQMLLGILDKGTLTSGKNVPIDMTKCVIVMTSNLGSREVKKILKNSGLGFVLNQAKGDSDESIYRHSKAVVEAFFSPEFFNRLDRMVVFRPLCPEALRKIVDVELKYVQDRLLQANKFIGLLTSERAKEFLIKEGTSPEYGARELKRAIERFLESKLRRGISSQQMETKDMVEIDHEESSDDLSLTILKGALILPKAKLAEPVEVKQPRAAKVEPEDPKARHPFPSIKHQDYCGRCGFRWFDNHLCFDLLDAPYERK